MKRYKEESGKCFRMEKAIVENKELSVHTQ
jgi:hypothetical protein